MLHGQSQQQDVIITSATSEDIPEIVDLTKMARTGMFPMLNSAAHNTHAHHELAGGFQKSFLDHPDGAFLIARLDGVLVATIGYVSYDNRFTHFQLGSDRAAEVIRLYVDPDLRRCGLASRLLASLEDTARHAGIKEFYLHTHPFLPGAVTFWERSGFKIISRDDEDLVWRTIHMSLPLTTGLAPTK